MTTSNTATVDIPATAVAPKTETLGPYRLDKLIGKRNGRVSFAATHQKRLNRAAVSVLQPLSGDERETFEREIAVAERLEHPSVARVLESGDCEGNPYVAFEYIEGITVQDIVKKEGKLSEAVACAIIRQAAIGLHHIHENGLLHGGMSSMNMMITRSGVVKILGLGLTAQTADFPTQPNASEAASYFAPEQLVEHGEPRSDIYGLGCSLYFMLTGTAPPTCLERQKSGQKIDLDELAPQTSPALVSVLRAMMDLEPTKRVQMLTQVVGAMCNWASEETLPSLVATHSEAEDTTPTYTQPEPIEESATAQPHIPDVKNIEFATPPVKAKSSIGPAVGILAIALAASFGGFLYLGRQPSLEIAGTTSAPETDTTANMPPRTVAYLKPAAIETAETIANEQATASAPIANTVETSQDPQPAVEQLEPSNNAGVAEATQPSQATTNETPSLPVAATPNETTQTVEVTQPVELEEIGQPSTETRLTAIGTLTNEAGVPHDESVDDYHNRLERQLHEDYGLSGGKWVLTPNEFALISSVVSYGQTVTQDETTDKEDFGRLVRMHVAGKGAKPWAAGLYIPEVEGIEKGDRVLAVVWMRTAPGSRSEGKVSIFVESASDHKKEVYLTVKPTSEWRQFMIPFQAKVARDLRIGFHLAFQKQNIDYGGLTLINFGKTAPFWNAIPAGPKRRVKID